MNKLSLGINLVLLVAVGYLYFHDFSGSKKATQSGKDMSPKTESCNTMHHIAYVELDSLNENLIYFKQNRKSLEVEQKQIEDKITADYKDLDALKNNFVKNNPNATPEQVQRVQMELAQGQQKIESEKQQKSELLNQKSFKIMEKIQKELKTFLSEYNKEKKYQYILTTGSGIDYLIYKDSTLDITKDVIKGMNDRMKNEIAKP